LFWHLYLFNLATAKIVKKKFIQRRCVHKVPRSWLARSPRAVVLAAAASGVSSSSSSSAPLSLGVREASVVEKALLAGTSPLVPTLRKKEDPVATPMANIVSISLVDATLIGFDLIVLSSGSEDEVDWEALIAKNEVDWEALAAKDVDDIEFVGS
jgi:hypothetical protein